MQFSLFGYFKLICGRGRRQCVHAIAEDRRMNGWTSFLFSCALLFWVQVCQCRLMRFKGHVVKLQLVFFLLCEVTLTSPFRCTYKYLLEVPFLQTGTTRPQISWSPQNTSFCANTRAGKSAAVCCMRVWESFVKVQSWLEEPRSQNQRDQNLSNGNDYVVRKSNE